MLVVIQSLPRFIMMFQSLAQAPLIRVPHGKQVTACFADFIIRALFLILTYFEHHVMCGDSWI